MVTSAVIIWSRGVCLSSNGDSPSQCARELTQKVDCARRLADVEQMLMWKPYVMNEAQPRDTGIEVTTRPVTPTKACNNRGDDEAHTED
jgi:hypothetical protein